MRLKPEDIASFAYCPFLYWRRGTTQVVSPLSTFENTIRNSILITEAKALKNNTYVNPRSLGNAWERTWWPAAANAGIDFSEAEKISLRAGLKLTNYCKYDISSHLYATIGTMVPFQIKLPKGILVGEIDMIKLPVDNADQQVVLIDFTRKGLSPTELANDFLVWSKVYAFRGLERNITYICIDIQEEKEQLKVVSASFGLNYMKEIQNTIEYFAEGIYKRINYRPIWTCNECKKCDS